MCLLFSIQLQNSSNPIHSFKKKDNQESTPGFTVGSQITGLPSSTSPEKLQMANKTPLGDFSSLYIGSKHTV